MPKASPSTSKRSASRTQSSIPRPVKRVSVPEKVKTVKPTTPAKRVLPADKPDARKVNTSSEPKRVSRVGTKLVTPGTLRSRQASDGGEKNPTEKTVIGKQRMEKPESVKKLKKNEKLKTPVLPGKDAESEKKEKDEKTSNVTARREVKEVLKRSGSDGERKEVEKSSPKAQRSIVKNSKKKGKKSPVMKITKAANSKVTPQKAEDKGKLDENPGTPPNLSLKKKKVTTKVPTKLATPDKKGEGIPEEKDTEEEKKTASETPEKELKGKSSTKSPKAATGSAKKVTKTGNGTPKKEPGSASKGKPEDLGNEIGSPDVTFQREMTKEKLALLNRSPLAGIISQENKDAAAEELYEKESKDKAGKGNVEASDAKELSKKKKRKAASEVNVTQKAVSTGKSKKKPNIKDADKPEEEKPVEDDSPAKAGNEEPLKKKAKTTTPEKPVDADDMAEMKARRKEERKMKRKVRRMRSKGELPDEEKEVAEPGVMYLGHIPHGFYEKEMRSYFSQFGEVTRLRLSRSKKTARSKGFAFIEFADSEVAQIAAEAMDGYLMFGQALVAKIVPPEKVHEGTFKGADRSFKKIPFAAIERRKLIERSRDPLKLAQRSKGVRKRDAEKKKRLAALGIEYDYPTIVAN